MEMLQEHIDLCCKVMGLGFSVSTDIRGTCGERGNVRFSSSRVIISVDSPSRVTHIQDTEMEKTMSYAPGHDTARFLSRQVACPCCNGKGHYEIANSADGGFTVGEMRRYQCENCHHGKLNWREYKDKFEWQFGPARAA